MLASAASLHPICSVTQGREEREKSLRVRKVRVSGPVYFSVPVGPRGGAEDIDEEDGEEGAGAVVERDLPNENLNITL